MMKMRCFGFLMFHMLRVCSTSVAQFFMCPNPVSFD